MPSRLSSLLVRDGLVGVKRMEKAFQRQVIYGGSLDTILLEMGLVPEERLTQYLALASGLPPASRDEGGAIGADAIAAIPKDLSEKHRAVPLAIAGEAVRILVCSPLELDELEDLADILDRPLQPLITPEYRWHLVFAAAYGGEAPARFTTLARALDTDAPVPPVGRGAAVIVDDRVRRPMTNPPPSAPELPEPPAPPVVASAPPANPIAPIAPDQNTLRMTSVEVEDALGRGGNAVGEREPSGRSHSSTLLGVQPNQATTGPIPIVPDPVPVPVPVPVPAAGRRDGVPDESFVAPTITFAPGVQPGRRRNSAGPVPGARGTSRVDTAPLDSTSRDAPLAVVRARELLATVEDRDTVFLTLLRAARSRARWAGLLTVQGGAAIGRVALAEGGLDTSSIARVLVPLDAPSPFRSAVTTQQPQVGPLHCGDDAIDTMLERLGGAAPPSGLILPIVLRERVVALVVAHRGAQDIRFADITELLPLAGATSDALGRLIVKHKSAGYRAPSEPVAAATGSAVPIEGAQIETKKLPRDQASAAWRRPEPGAVAGPPPVVEREPEPSIVVAPPPPEPIDKLLAQIEEAREGGADDAVAEAVERAPEALGELMRRFPGKLRVDRFGVTGRALRAAQYGGLLELVIQLGSVAAELLIDKMSAPQRDVRFYATVCAAELRPRSAVYALVERVFDQDFGVRAMAIEALAGYPVQDLGSAMLRARRALHGDDPEVVGAAQSAIVALGDVEAIPDLISVVEKQARIGDYARKALVALTAQDFGTSERKWRKWWDAQRTKHRVEWLIDGLTHKDDAIREAAIVDLRRLTGEYFGYHHDLPRKDREQAAARWAAWWKDAGQRRFVHRDDERNRPTAMMPARRDET